MSAAETGLSAMAEADREITSAAQRPLATAKTIAVPGM